MKFFKTYAAPPTMSNGPNNEQWVRLQAYTVGLPWCGHEPSRPPSTPMALSPLPNAAHHPACIQALWPTQQTQFPLFALADPRTFTSSPPHPPTYAPSPSDPLTFTSSPPHPHSAYLPACPPYSCLPACVRAAYGEQRAPIWPPEQGAPGVLHAAPAFDPGAPPAHP